MTPQKIVIIGELIFLADIPISGQTGIPVEGSTWYDQHGFPNPDNPAQVVQYRTLAEKQRLEKREEDFWAEIGKRVKFTATIEEDNSIDSSEGGQCISSPS